MVTTIAPGSVFVMRERGGYTAWRVSENGSAYTGVRTPLQAGEVVHLAVWKGTRLESRKSYVLKPGDVEWVDTGIKAIDFSKPPSVIYGHAELPTTIWKNKFVGGPVWLRNAD
jgi:hypothetical protein